MSGTNIEWTDRVWSPVTGCQKVSPGCKHCYAEGVAHRFWATQYPAVVEPFKDGSGRIERPRRFTDVLTHDDRLLEPLSWRKPQKVFVNSMSDLFHEDVPDAFIDQVFAVMALTPRHTFQVLTKRPERMRDYVVSRGGQSRAVQIAAILQNADSDTQTPQVVWPLPNVWKGVSVEDQPRADERIPLLLETPAAVRFVSAEPLLAPIDFTLSGARIKDWDEDWRYNVLSGEEWAGARADSVERSQHLDWVIVGGESGPGARACEVAWVQAIVKQCHAAGTAVFVKQLGGGAIRIFVDFDAALAGDRTWRVVLDDRKGGDPAEWPEDLRVREFPR